MTPPPDELDLATLHELLASDDVWVDPDPATESAVVDAIVGDRGQIRPPGRPRARRSLTAAAVLAAISVGAVVGTLALSRDAAAPGVAVALAAADPSASMSASATVDRRPGGVRIVLDVGNLPPAEAGTFYQAWLTNDVERVSAGTFHLRGSTGEIELWCGIDEPGYSTLAVTLERMGADDGPVVLTGRIDR